MSLCSNAMASKKIGEVLWQLNQEGVVGHALFQQANFCHQLQHFLPQKVEVEGVHRLEALAQQEGLEHELQELVVVVGLHALEEVEGQLHQKVVEVVVVVLCPKAVEVVVELLAVVEEGAVEHLEKMGEVEVGF